MIESLGLWLGDMTNSKVTALLIFFPAFIAILYYVYGNSERSRRLESYKNMPFTEGSDSKEDGSDNGEDLPT